MIGFESPSEDADAIERSLEALDRTIPSPSEVSDHVDVYFSHARRVVERGGDCRGRYAVFMRRRVIAALVPAERLIRRLAPEATVTRLFAEGEEVPAEAKMMEIEGSLARLSELETLILQRVGVPCVCAYNAHEMCRALPRSRFIDMHGRHAAGAEMNLLAAYGAATGSRSARRLDSEGFIGSSQRLTAGFYGSPAPLGTMPHALVGYFGGSALEALKAFVDSVSDSSYAAALVDYRGREIDDALECAEWFYSLSSVRRRDLRFGVRLDTHGGQFAQGLDYESSVRMVGEWIGERGEYNIVERALGATAAQMDADHALTDAARRDLFGKGVSAAATIHLRRALDSAGFREALLIASSGFDVRKCHFFGAVDAPADVVGTGSFLPATLAETYAVADVVAYDGVPRVKAGRERLLSS